MASAKKKKKKKLKNKNLVNKNESSSGFVGFSYFIFKKIYFFLGLPWKVFICHIFPFSLRLAMKSVDSWRSDASAGSASSDRALARASTRRRARIMKRNTSSGERGVAVGRPLSGSNFVSDMKRGLPPVPPPSSSNDQKFHKVIDELICTEIDYHDTLEQLLEKYVAGIAAISAGKGGSKITGLTKEEVDIIFGGLRPILEVSSRALSKIEALEDVHDGQEIAEIFVQLAPNFAACYSWYASCYKSGLSLLRMKMKDKKKKLRHSSGSSVKFPRLLSSKSLRKSKSLKSTLSFIAAWKNAQESSECPNLKGQSLESLLIMPIQHVPRYRLLFDEMAVKAKKGNAGASVVSSLEDARDAMNLTATFINNSVKKREKLEGVMGADVSQEKESPIAAHRRGSAIIDTERKAFLRTMPTQLIRSAEWTPSMLTNDTATRRMSVSPRGQSDVYATNAPDSAETPLRRLGSRRGTAGGIMLRPNGTTPRSSGGLISRQRSFTDSGNTAAPIAKKKNLIRIWSASHEAFYLYNRETGATVWEGNESADEDDNEEDYGAVVDITNARTSRLMGVISSSSISTNAQQPDMHRTVSEPPLPVAAEPPLPPGWTTHLDTSSGSHYYYHEGTGESTWVRPAQ